MDGNSVVRPRNYFIGAAALIMAGLVLGLGLSAGLDLQRNSGAASAELAAVTNSAPLPESPFVGVVDKALPAVVFIDVRKKSAASDDPNDEFMRRFFGDNGSRRQQRVPSSGSGFLDCSTAVHVLDVPTAKIDRSMGDIHPTGNPHYLYDPRQAVKCAQAIRDKLSANDGAGARTYAANTNAFPRPARVIVQRNGTIDTDGHRE